MSTSGTTTWKLNRDAVISAALRKLSVLSGGSTPETYQVTTAILQWGTQRACEELH